MKWPPRVFLTKRVAIGRASQPFPRSKPSGRISTHSAFQLGLCTFLRWVRGIEPRGDAPIEVRHNPLHCVPRYAGEQGAIPSTVICFSPFTFSEGVRQTLPGRPSPCLDHYSRAFDYYAASALLPASWHFRFHHWSSGTGVPKF